MGTTPSKYSIFHVPTNATSPLTVTATGVCRDKSALANGRKPHPATARA